MQRHEMIAAMSGLGLKGMAAAFDEAVTTGVQRKRTVSLSITHNGLNARVAEEAGLLLRNPV